MAQCKAVQEFQPIFTMQTQAMRRIEYQCGTRLKLVQQIVKDIRTQRWALHVLLSNLKGHRSTIGDKVRNFKSLFEEQTKGFHTILNAFEPNLKAVCYFYPSNFFPS